MSFLPKSAAKQRFAPAVNSKEKFLFYFFQYVSEHFARKSKALKMPRSDPTPATFWGPYRVIPNGRMRNRGRSQATPGRLETQSNTRERDTTMMKFAKLFKNFRADESGAVTVDWVVLTAAIVGLGLVVMNTVGGGVKDLAGDINTNLTNSTVGLSTTTTP